MSFLEETSAAPDSVEHRMVMPMVTNVNEGFSYTEQSAEKKTDAVDDFADRVRSLLQEWGEKSQSLPTGYIVYALGSSGARDERLGANVEAALQRLEERKEVCRTYLPNYQDAIISLMHMREQQKSAA